MLYRHHTTSQGTVESRLHVSRFSGDSLHTPPEILSSYLSSISQGRTLHALCLLQPPYLNGSLKILLDTLIISLRGEPSIALLQGPKCYAIYATRPLLPSAEDFDVLDSREVYKISAVKQSLFYCRLVTRKYLLQTAASTVLTLLSGCSSA